MARLNKSLCDVVEDTGLDERTIRSVLRGKTRPHTRTLHRLAAGLGISTDELFQSVDQLEAVESSASSFDRATNPTVTEVIQDQPELFEDWNKNDFDELYSRVAVGGELSTHGVKTAAEAMNTRRQLLYEVSVILESSEADIMRDFIKLMFQRVTDFSS